ncbi:glyoxalase [Mesorhizobium tianshanense]|uniref:VOC family protein n=1 Tax=Mesorhizobium tianshanense TaxID=39844 RepID=UPI0011A4C6A6|nr:VOC family protein [Mesorhizobium tianshanense]GLS35050.1 glyoxalase [Mesorhizobium tianshanense]
MDDPFKHATIGSGVFYRQPTAALDWLEKAFGFRRSVVVTDKDENIVHSEMRFGDAYLIVDSEWSQDIASPLSVGGRNTQSVYVKLPHGIDQHCETARLAGAEIVQEPEDQLYGNRIYRARDPEGHIWTFSQTVAHVIRETAEHLSGCRIEGWHQD